MPTWTINSDDDGRRQVTYEDGGQVFACGTTEDEWRSNDPIIGWVASEAAPLDIIVVDGAALVVMAPAEA